VQRHINQTKKSRHPELVSGSLTNISRALITILITVITLSLISLSVTPSFAAPDKEDDTDYATLPEVAGEGCILIDQTTGQVLFEKNMNERLEPASCTKILTALLALENKQITDEVTVDEEAYQQEGSGVYLLPGEVVTIDQLMYAAMLESGNDAAMALAKAVAGSKEAFADMMNAKVEELGLGNSHFLNPNGLPEENHYSTAYDLAMIARECMKNADFRRYVSTYEYVMDSTNMQPEKRYFHNSNRLLYSTGRHVTVYGKRVVVKYEYATGIKTGYTVNARNCIVAGAEKDGQSLIAVSLKAEGTVNYQDVMNMFEYGFHNFENRQVLAPRGESVELEVTDGEADTVTAVSSGEIIGTFNTSDTTQVEIKTELFQAGAGGAPVISGTAIAAPVSRGALVGFAVAYLDGKEIGRSELILADSVAKKEAPPSIIDIFDAGPVPAILKVVGIVALAGLIWFVILVIRAELKRRRRRARRRGTYGGYYGGREVRRIKRM
jgi:D-alanyl-D-alanine carboxypeptidase (penicillin-binding protein 5/6)